MKATTIYLLGFPHSSVGRESACNAGDPGSIPGLGKSPEEGNGNPFQYFSLENSMDRGARQATVHEVKRVGHDLATKQQRLLRGYKPISASSSERWTNQILRPQTRYQPNRS